MRLGLRSHGQWAMVLGAMALVLLAARGASADPFRLLFWQPRDIRDGREVRFRAHVFRPEERIVLLAADPGRPGLWYMPTDVVRAGEELRIYYQRVDTGLPHATDQRVWCVGILKGERLVLPDLKLFPAPWGGPANVVLQRSPHKPTWGGFNVFQIARPAADAWRLLYWDQPAAGPAGALLAESPDGLQWRKEEGRALFTEPNDAFTLVRDTAGGPAARWLLYQTRLEDWPDKPFPDNLPGKRRVIALRSSPDLKRWTAQATVLRPDGQDAPATEFYLLKVFRYVDRWVGLLMVYYGDPGRPHRHSALVRTELVFRGDGRDWERPFRYTDVGAWSYADPFEQAGRLCLTIHHQRSLCLLRTRPDGLACCGTEAEGAFCTPPFPLPKEPLLLNADCRGGSIRVELLDEKGKTIVGYEAERRTWADRDQPDLPLLWQGKSPTERAGQTAHLRFHLRRAWVYSVRASTAAPQVSP